MNCSVPDSFEHCQASAAWRVRDGSESNLTDGGGTGLARCGNLNRVRFEPKATVGSSCLSVNKECGNDEHARGDANLNRLIFPQRPNSVRQAFVGRRVGDWSGKFPSAGAVKMGPLALRCVQRAHGRSY